MTVWWVRSNDWLGARPGTRTSRRTRSTLGAMANELPLSFRDDFDSAIDHFDGSFVVDRVRRTADTCRPSFGGGHGVQRQIWVVQVREDREADESQRHVIPCDRWLRRDERLSDT